MVCQNYNHDWYEIAFFFNSAVGQDASHHFASQDFVLRLVKIEFILGLVLGSGSGYGMKWFGLW